MKYCKYPHCDMKVKARGFCEKHYRRFSKMETNVQKQRLRPPIDSHEYHAIYVIGCFHFAPVKIGLTNNIWKRVSALQTGCPYRLFVFGARFSTPEIITGLEWEVHKTLTELECACRGEWFDIDPNDALAVIDKCAELQEFPILTPERYKVLRETDLDGGVLHRNLSAPTHTDMEMIYGSIESAQKLLTQGVDLDNTYL